MKIFALNDTQTKRFDAWFKHHFDVVHGPKWYPRDVSGATLKFTIVPTGSGDNITCECIWCPEDGPSHSVVLTTDDGDEFIYDYDENWNRLKASWE